MKEVKKKSRNKQKILLDPSSRVYGHIRAITQTVMGGGAMDGQTVTNGRTGA